MKRLPHQTGYFVSKAAVTASLIQGEQSLCSMKGTPEPWQGGDLLSLPAGRSCCVVLSHSMFQIPKKCGSALDLILLWFFEVGKCRLCQICGVRKAWPIHLQVQFLIFSVNVLLLFFFMYFTANTSITLILSALASIIIWHCV